MNAPSSRMRVQEGILSLQAHLAKRMSKQEVDWYVSWFDVCVRCLRVMCDVCCVLSAV